MRPTPRAGRNARSACSCPAFEVKARAAQAVGSVGAAIRWTPTCLQTVWKRQVSEVLG